MVGLLLFPMRTLAFWGVILTLWHVYLCCFSKCLHIIITFISVGHMDKCMKQSHMVTHVNYVVLNAMPCVICSNTPLCRQGKWSWHGEEAVFLLFLHIYVFIFLLPNHNLSGRERIFKQWWPYICYSYSPFLPMLIKITLRIRLSCVYFSKHDFCHFHIIKNVKQNESRFNLPSSLFLAQELRYFTKYFLLD